MIYSLNGRIATTKQLLFFKEKLHTDINYKAFQESDGCFCSWNWKICGRKNDVISLAWSCHMSKEITQYQKLNRKTPVQKGAIIVYISWLLKRKNNIFLKILIDKWLTHCCLFYFLILSHLLFLPAPLKLIAPSWWYLYYDR